MSEDHRDREIRNQLIRIIEDSAQGKRPKVDQDIISALWQAYYALMK